MKFGFQMVWYSNGQFMCYVLYTRPTIQILDQCIGKQNGVHLSSIQMVWLSGFQMAFEYWTIWHPTAFQPLEYRTSSVLRSPLYYCHGKEELKAFIKRILNRSQTQEYPKHRPELSVTSNISYLVKMEPNYIQVL